MDKSSNNKLKVSIRTEHIHHTYLKAEMATLLINRSDRSFDRADRLLVQV